MKDKSKLTRKIITDKTGKRTTVWVKQGNGQGKSAKKPDVSTQEKRDKIWADAGDMSNKVKEQSKEHDKLNKKEGKKESPKKDDTTKFYIGNKGGKEVEEISMKLEELAKMAEVAKREGKSAPNFNLCKVTIPNTNLFCADNKGVKRAQMPQLKGDAVEGTKADKIAKKTGGDRGGDKGVDGEELFKKHLVDKGVKMTKKDVPAQYLKATQTELVGAKVAGMTEALKDNPNHEGITAPIFVSRDGYILDGHHRWASHVGLAMSKENKGKPVKMSTIVVDMSIEDLLKETNDWAKDFGIAQKSGKIKKALDELCVIC